MHSAATEPQTTDHPLILGAGIAGLTLALCLQRACPQTPAPQVVEAAPRLAPLGVGLNLLPHAMRVFDALDIADDVARAGNPITSMTYHTRLGQQVLDEPRGSAAGFRWPQVAIHRAALHQVLVDVHRRRIPEPPLRLGASGTAMGPTGTVRIEARGSDRGSTAVEEIRAPFVVAADGIHSTTRARLYPHQGDPIWNGIVMWRGTSRVAAPWGENRMIVAGDRGAKFVAYPITRPDPDGTQIVNWVAESATGEDAPPPAWNHEVGPGRAIDIFGTWTVAGTTLAPLLAAADRVVEYPMVDRDPVPTWTDGRATLIGDAAHPMHPVGSNGASQAILDCAVLSAHLAATTDVESAFGAYEAERLPAAYKVVESNRAFRPEGILQVVADRAPQGFEKLSDVVTDAELDELLADYRATAGFDISALNEGRTGIPVDHLDGR